MSLNSLQDSDRERETVILAALLHDIGKFRQRANQPIPEQYREIQTHCLPLFKGRYSHEHALHSGKFVQDVLGNNWDSVEHLVLYHHKPENYATNSYLAKLITLADWLASGERRGKEDEEPTGVPGKDPLVSVFSRLNIANETAEQRYCPLLPLQIDLSDLSPVDTREKAVKPDSYTNLWNAFIGESKKIDFSQRCEIFFNQLLAVLEKYTLFIPAATYRDIPDISLYHHLKSTAAIAACLYDLHYEETAIDSILKDIDKSDAPVGYLIGGDISGIQEFIYSVTSEHALKGLRGRSLYLQLLSDAISRSILTACNLPVSNIIYAGGGHFYILIPATEKAKDKVDALERHVNRVLLNAHRGKLAVIFGIRKLTVYDFDKQRFGTVWIELGLELARKKKQKFAKLLEHPELSQQILGPYDVGGENPACEICSDEIDTGQHCEFCQSFASLASDAARATYIQINPVSVTTENVSSWNTVLNQLGWNYQFEQNLNEPEYSYRLNSLDFLNGKGCLGSYFIAKHTPFSAHGQIKNLEQIAQEADGIKKWGVLRADVDHLGKIFKDGLGEDKTISRISMLSYLFSLFFTLQIETIIKQRRFADKVYITYSGGDDLCILGAWSVLPQLAQEIHTAFRKFTCNHPTLSAGIYLAPSAKFPIYQAANQAGEAVEQAKADGRNRITLFNRSIPWETFVQLAELKEKLVTLLNQSTPRALLSMLSATAMEKKLLVENKIPMERIWRLLYALKRMAQRYKSSNDYPDRAERILELRNYFIRNHTYTPDTDIAIRWADFLTRERSNEL